MILAIMTRGRVGRQETLKWIPDEWKGRTVLVCPEEEALEHEKMIDEEIAVYPVNCHNYSDKFQKIYDGRILPNTQKVVIMDDDIFFSKYEGDTLRKIQNPNDLEDMFAYMQDLLDKFPLVGVHPRANALAMKNRVVEICGKIVTIQGINRDIAPQNLKLDYDPILADVWLNCEILSRGIPTARICTHFVDWKPSQAPGGCDYRTAEMQREATARIANRFGPFAQQVIKEPKTAKWLGDSRYDLRVQWKELYKHGCKTRLLDQRARECEAEERRRDAETLE